MQKRNYKFYLSKASFTDHLAFPNIRQRHNSAFEFGHGNVGGDQRDGHLRDTSASHRLETIRNALLHHPEREQIGILRTLCVIF
mgnify:CR=1 FL=1